MAAVATLWCVGWLALRWYGLGAALLAELLLVVWRSNLTQGATGLPLLDVARVARYDVLAVAFDRHLVTLRSHQRTRQEQDGNGPENRREQNDCSSPECSAPLPRPARSVDARSLFGDTALLRSAAKQLQVIDHEQADAVLAHQYAGAWHQIADG